MRQLLNVAYSILAEGRDEESLESLDAELGMIEDPAAGAREALAEYQRRAGIVIEQPDAPVAGQAPDDGLDEWMRSGG